MSDPPPLLLTRDGAVARLTLNRPARRNALNDALGVALDAALAALAADRTARIVVLAGAGGQFCAGLDLGEVAAAADPAAKEAAERARNQAIGARFAALAALPQVVIAAVEGSAFAGGLGLVCAADLAFAAGSARFAAPEARRGLVPAQILPWLVRRMGRAQATRLVLEGAAIDAPTAERIGLLHAAVADAVALQALLDATIDHLLLAGPHALTETKGLLAALGLLAPPDYAEAAAAAFARCAASEETAEGIAAFREKRRPRWAGQPAGKSGAGMAR